MDSLCISRKDGCELGHGASSDDPALPLSRDILGLPARVLLLELGLCTSSVPDLDFLGPTSDAGLLLSLGRRRGRRRGRSF